MRWNIHIYTDPESVLIVLSRMLSTTFNYLYNFKSAISFKVISRFFLVNSRTAEVVCADTL